MRTTRFLNPLVAIGFAAAAVCNYSTPAQAQRVRESYKTLQQTAAGRQNLTDFVAAIKALKLVDPNADQPALLGYNDFVRMHSSAPAPPPQGYTAYAHMLPTFLAWHRIFLLRFEDALRTVNPNVTVPYWDWTADPFPSDITTGDNMLMGPNGSGTTHVVQSGPFSPGAGWVCYRAAGISNASWLGSDLQRNFGADGITLPSTADVDSALSVISFDIKPWDRNSVPENSFRNTLEGWEPDPPRLHNRVHVYIGGQMKTVPQAINDPVFWMHHANIDRVWCKWQKMHDAEFHHLPRGGVNDPHPKTCLKPGFCAFDPMPPFTTNGELPPQEMPFDAINMMAYNYEYDDCQGACRNGDFGGQTTSQILLSQEV